MEGRTQDMNGTRKERVVKSNQPCPDCGSSDALCIYEHSTYCFSCTKYNKLDNTNLSFMFPLLKEPLLKGSLRDLVPSKLKESNNTLQYIADRGITRGTMEYYKVYTSVDLEGIPVGISFPYGTYEIYRRLPLKHFTTHGDASDPKLFGQDQFIPGGNRSITITEGAYDAMAIYELLRYPAVSVRSASSARLDCERAREYLNSFDNIILCFDADGPGEEATREVARLFDISKVKHVKLSNFKDANEALVKDPQQLKAAWYNARIYSPKEIVSDFASIKEIIEGEEAQAIASYPFSTLERMAYGIRSSELILFTALEKVGKTEVLRAIEHHLLKTTDENIGIIHLEEGVKRSVNGLVGYELGLPVHLPDAGVSNRDISNTFESLVKRDGRLCFYNHFGGQDPDAVLDAIRYLVGVRHCKFVFLDHITMLVTSYEDEDERRTLDRLSTGLAMMTRELDFTLFMVSHVNDAGQTRGSRNIAKVADLIIHLERDLDQGSNQTRVLCRGNRFAGLTGPSGTLVFDPKTFVLKEQVVDTLRQDGPDLAQAEVLEVVRPEQPTIPHSGNGTTSLVNKVQGFDITSVFGQGGDPWSRSVSN